MEAAYLMIKGVSSAVSGYAGGSEKDAEYYTVGSGTTGHAEVVQVTFDPAIISLADIFEIFFTIHNPCRKCLVGWLRNPIDTGPLGDVKFSSCGKILLGLGLSLPLA